MKILIDTNVLISAALSSAGLPYKAFVKAVTAPNQGVICEQNIDEMRRVFNRKFPHKIQALESFLSIALLTLEVIPVPTEETPMKYDVRDVDDRPLLRAAMNTDVDILLTGDSDFLCADISRPKIMTCAQFLSEA